jgi:cell division protein FtsA
MAKAQIAERVPREVLLAEVVITGGGAHLHGIEAAASDFFGVPVRVGVPSAVGGLTDAVKQPQYSTAVGLVMFGPKGDGMAAVGGRSGQNVLARVANWLSDMWN